MARLDYGAATHDNIQAMQDSHISLWDGHRCAPITPPG